MLKKIKINKEEKMTKEKKESGFMLIALKPFNARGVNFKIGDRVSPRMTYFQAIKKCKQHNVGHSVGVSKRVEMKPYIPFKSSWQIASLKELMSSNDLKGNRSKLNMRL